MEVCSKRSPGSRTVCVLAPTTSYSSRQDTPNDTQLTNPLVLHRTQNPGSLQGPRGYSNGTICQLRRKSDHITSFLWKCPLTRIEAWTYYYACYLPSVCYPLLCSSLSKKQLDTVQRKAMAILTARCGFNCNTRKEILYGPLDLGGANFRQLYIEQGMGQLNLFILH
jgi:hypothetical protein